MKKLLLVFPLFFTFLILVDRFEHRMDIVEKEVEKKNERRGKRNRKYIKLKDVRFQKKTIDKCQ